LLPVHASAVEVEGRAIMFTGVSGAGKSTLANAFLRRGYRFLSDDIVPIEVVDGRARVLPSLARIRLWPDSAKQAEWPIHDLEQCRTGLSKVAGSVDPATMSGPLDPHAVFHLQPKSAGARDLAIIPIHGGNAVSALSTRVYRERGLAAIAGETGARRRVATAAAHIPHHFRLERKPDYASLDATVDAILHALQ
jgi:hypothetical protein